MNELNDELNARSNHNGYHEKSLLKAKDGSNWDWTMGIPIKTVGIISVQARSTTNAYQYKLIRIEKRLIESTIYIIIDKEDLKHPTYMIENNSKNISIMMYQKGCNNSVDYIDVMEKMPYGVTNPESNDNKLIWQFFIGSLKDNPLLIDDIAAEISFDSIDDDEIIKIPTGFCTGRILHLKTYTDGKTKFIRFSDTVEVETTENKNDASKCLDVKIKEIGFSVISQISKIERKEIAYIYMKEILFQMIDTSTHRIINFSLENLQIDNQIDYNILFPVMFRPSSRKRNKPAIEFSVTIKTDTGEKQKGLENLLVIGKYFFK